MKRIFAAMLTCILLLTTAVTALAIHIDFTVLTDTELDELIHEATSERNSRQTAHIPVAVKASPDKYTWFVQNYVGRNAASFGYTSLGGDRLERYGAGYLEFVFVTEDGMAIDTEDEIQLKKYIVTGQNIEPNTEMKLVFQKDSKGEEYSNLVDYQSIRLIDLTVRRIDGVLAGDPIAFDLIHIQPSPNKYTWYIQNYVGKNVASFGYTSLGGDRLDEYGAAHIRFSFVSDDGAYLDPEDIDLLKQYIVTGQDIAPNTELRLTMQKNSKGEEYSNLVDAQTYEGITLYVHKLNIEYPEASSVQEQDGETATASSQLTAIPFVSDGTIRSYRDVQYILLDDGTAEISGYTSAKGSITIPSEVDGYKVTRIGEAAFKDCTELKNLINWAELTHIGAFAFQGCTALKEISIPGETVYIGESAFEGCTNLKTVIMWGEPTGIEKNTFKNCSRLSEISLPSSVTYIAESAFENCTNIGTVIIWGDISSIGANAFKNCTSLDDVSVPSSTEVIGESAFEGCTDLESVILWGDTNIGNSAFRGCISIEEINISSGTEHIGDYAFKGCSSLENVYMWGRSTKIGKDAFANCPKLKNVPE